MKVKMFILLARNKTLVKGLKMSKELQIVYKVDLEILENDIKKLYHRINDLTVELLELQGDDTGGETYKEIVSKYKLSFE